MKFNINKLVYFEIFNYIDLAIAREKQIKGYTYLKKVALVNTNNPEWKELDSIKGYSSLRSE